MTNLFFKNKGPFNISKLLKLASIDNSENLNKSKVRDIKDLVSAKEGEITFFHLKKYELAASNTKASYCITTKNLANLLPENCKKIIVENVLISTAQITKVFYPNSISDDFDDTVKEINDTKFNDNVKFGKNVLICLLYTSPSPRDAHESRMPSSA